MNDVVILGAGFSCAVDPITFPDANKLGQDAIISAGLEHDDDVPKMAFTRDFTFESWMSILAEEQPYLDEAANAKNALLYKKLIAAIGNDLLQATNVAISKGLPSWLYELVSVMHFRQSTVISFNYDTLIESAIETSQMFRSGTGQRLSPQWILRDLPPPAIPEHRIDPYDCTFRLLKLHGSLDWWWVPSDASGATLNRSTLSRHDKSRIFQSMRRQQLPGRSPFIVPPSATKSAYFRNPITRELWQSAFEALQFADRITLIGYSLPPADVVMSGMLERALANRSAHPEIEVVDLCPKWPIDRIVGLGAQRNHIEPTEDIPAFVRNYSYRASQEFIGELNGSDSDWWNGTAINIGVGGHPNGESPAFFRVTKVTAPNSEGIVDLTYDRYVRLHPSIKGAEDPHPKTGEPMARAEDLFRAVKGAIRVVAHEENSSESTVVIGSWGDYVQSDGAPLMWNLATATIGAEPIAR